MQYKEINMSTTSNTNSSVFLPQTYWINGLGNLTRKSNIYGLDNEFKTVDIGDANRAAMENTPIQSNPGHSNTELSFGDRINNWFTPTGENGTSVGGNVLSGLGTVAGIGGTLADVYYKHKSNKREEEAADYERKRVALADKNVATFAKNTGNGASYQGVV